MGSEKIMKVEDVKKIELKEGDVLAVKLPKECTKYDVDKAL